MNVEHAFAVAAASVSVSMHPSASTYVYVARALALAFQFAVPRGSARVSFDTICSSMMLRRVSKFGLRNYICNNLSIFLYFLQLYLIFPSSKEI